MKNSLRKNLYHATKAQHLAVEDVFDLGNNLEEKKLALFHYSIYCARVLCAPVLNHLERDRPIQTHNTLLIEELKKDLDTTKFDINIDTDQFDISNLNTENLSVQTGVFYVFAGSSMGAKMIVAKAKKQSIATPLNYLSALSGKAKDQMIHLSQLLENEQLDKEHVITSAQQTFSLIHKIATDELRKRNTAFLGA